MENKFKKYATERTTYSWHEDCFVAVIINIIKNYDICAMKQNVSKKIQRDVNRIKEEIVFLVKKLLKCLWRFFEFTRIVSLVQHISVVNINPVRFSDS